MIRALLRIPALLAVLTLLGSCRKAEEPAPARQQAPPSAPAKAPAPASAPTPSPRADAPPSDRKAAVEAALQRYGESVKRMDDEAISGTFISDGEMGTAGGPPIKGRTRIALHIRKLKDFRVKSNVVTSESVTFSGDEAIQKGTFHHVAVSPGGKTIESRGRLEAVWTLEPDGVWRLKKLTAFPDKPAEVGKPKG